MPRIVARGLERIAVAGGRVARHEDRPAQQSDDLHERGGDPDTDRDPHLAPVREPADADGDRREHRGGQREDREPGADRTLVLAEGRKDIGRRFVEHVRVVEDRAERGERDVRQHGGEDEQDSGELAVHGRSLSEVDW